MLTLCVIFALYSSLSFKIDLFRIYLFWKMFKATEKWQEYYNKFPYAQP